MDILFYIFYGVFAIAVAFACIKYVRNNSKTSKKISNNPQTYVKENRNIYGVSNKGTSLNDKEIYVISHEGMGL